MSSNNHPRLFFVHIPKCGGMSLHAIIEKEYEQEEIYTVPSVDWNDQNLDALYNEWEQKDKDRLRIVKGHMPHGWHGAFGDDDYEYITIVRHPVERVLSFYSFIGDWHPDHTESLDELIENSDETNNLATFMLSGGMGRNAEAFEVAWARVLSGEIVAGTLDNFDSFVCRLRGRYGWSDTLYDVVNKTPNRISADEITKEQRKKIIGRNWMDMLLYFGIKGRGTRL